MVPTRAIVATAFPRVTQRNQTIDACSTIKQEVESGRCLGDEIADVDITSSELGNRMAEHWWLGDRRMTFALPKVAVMIR